MGDTTLKNFKYRLFQQNYTRRRLTKKKKKKVPEIHI